MLPLTLKRFTVVMRIGLICLQGASYVFTVTERYSTVHRTLSSSTTFQLENKSSNQQ